MTVLLQEGPAWPELSMGHFLPPSRRHPGHGAAVGGANALSRWLDRGAIGLSGLCLVHCLAFPVIVALLPATAPLLPQRPWVHPAILATALPLAALALSRGWQQHRDLRPGLLGFVGLVSMGVGLLTGDGSVMETVLTVIGGLLLASAHAMNWRLDHVSRFHAPDALTRE